MGVQIPHTLTGVSRHERETEKKEKNSVLGQYLPNHKVRIFRDFFFFFFFLFYLLLKRLGIIMVHTVQGEEEATPTMVAPEMILMSYKVIDYALMRVSIVQTFGLRAPRPRTLTIAVKSKGGIYVIIELYADQGASGGSRLSRGTRFERAAYTYRSCVVWTSSRNLSRCNV
jgi:hypothetical protein